MASLEELTANDVRNAAISAALELLSELRGPEEQFLHLSYAVCSRSNPFDSAAANVRGCKSVDSANIAVLLRFDIAQGIPVDSFISAEDLASTVGLPVDVLTRVVRYAITNGIFREPSKGKFAHSTISAYIAKHEHVRDIASIATQELANMNLSLAEALTQQRMTGGKSPAAAFNVAYPDFANAFEFIRSDPGRGHRYHKYLAGRTQLPLWDVQHLARSWNWAEKIGSGTLVDLGGSSGHTCMALAPICPEAKFIVQDIDPRGLQQGREAVADADASIARRVQFVEHDLFTPNPYRADVYLFRHILHDWSDEDVIRLLNNLVPVLSSGTRVLVGEGIMPTGEARITGALSEKQIRLEDMFMLAVHGARERSVDEFVALFQAASNRFRLVGVTGGQGGAFQSLLEMEYAA